MASQLSERQRKLQEATVDAINKKYYDGAINQRQRNALLIEKAHATTAGMLAKEGPVVAIYHKTIEHMVKGWDNILEAATRGDHLYVYNVGLALWGQVQIVTSAFSAMGEITGQMAENNAMAAGAPPGLARVIGIGTEVLVGGGVPIGKAFQAGAKGLQMAAGKVPGKLEEAVPLAKRLADQALSREQVIARDALAEGLRLDGVKDAEKLVTESAAAASGATKEEIKAAADALRKERGAVRPDYEPMMPHTEGVPMTEVKPTAAQFEAITEGTTKQIASRFERDRGKIMRTSSNNQAASELPALLKKFGIATEDVPQGTLTAKQLYAHLKALEGETETLTALAKQALAGDEAAGTAFARYATELFARAPNERISYSTKFMDLLSYWDPAAVAAGNITGAMRSFATDIVNIAERTKGVGEAGVNTLGMFVFGAQGMLGRVGEKAWPAVKEVYANLLLPFAWIPTALGNSIALGTEVVERTAGGLLTIDKQRGVIAREGFYEAKGMTLAIGDAFKAFGNVIVRHVKAGDTRFDKMEDVIPGVFGQAVRIPRELTIATDELTKVLARRANNYAEAIRVGARDLEFKGTKLGDFVTQRAMNPLEDTLKRSEQLATTVAFQNQLGSIGKMAGRIAQTGPGYLYFPFFKNMVNTLKWSWYRTPYLQLFQAKLYKDILAGGEAADRAIGMLTISNLWGYFVYEMAKEGFITGRGPVDPVLNKVWRATHEPYSVKTSGGYIPITNIEPANTPVGMIADFVEVSDSLNDAEFTQTGMAILYAVMHSFGTNQMSFKTGSDLVDMVQGIGRGEDWMKHGTKVLMRPITTIVTGGPVGARLTRALDPTLRDARTFTEDRAAHTPWRSTSVPPLRDAFSDPIIPPQTIGTSWLGFFAPVVPRYKAQTTDRIKLEADRLQAKMPTVPQGIGGNIDEDFNIKESKPGDRIPVPLSRVQQERVAIVFKNMFRHAKDGIEKQVLDNPEYKSTITSEGVEQQPIAAQRAMFEGQMHSYMNAAVKTVVGTDPDLAEKVVRAQAGAALPKMVPSQRLDTLQQLQENIDLFRSFSEQDKQELFKWGYFEGTDLMKPDEIKPTIEMEIRR
jgi:hypothetical protein